MNPTLDTLLHRNSLRPNQMQEPAPSDAELQTILRAATRVSRGSWMFIANPCKKNSSPPRSAFGRVKALTPMPR